MSKIEVNQISSQCGSTLTIGQSGDTVTLASGATQTGFGRTGTVDWNTTTKTTNFTAVSGNGYFVNTTSGAITMTLPATPSAGDIVAISDYANTFGTNLFTINRNGSLINGSANNYETSTSGISLTFVYVDGTRGWKNVNDATTDATGQPPFIIATGGTVVTCGNYKTHIFTSSGTFTVSNIAPAPSGNPNSLEYIVVAGGGGGASANGGGGGAGGFRLSSGGCIPAPTMSPLVSSALTATAASYPITVGAGGAAGVYPAPTPAEFRGCSGSNSIFSTITSAGGGGGGIYQAGPYAPGISGGSGGGGGGEGGGSPGTGNTPSVSPPQGNDGGAGGTGPVPRASGGGGGAGGTGGSGAGSQDAGNGGTGSFLADAFIGPTAPSYGTPGPVGSTRYFAGGGGGGVESTPALGLGSNGSGGVGGGGQGGPAPTTIGAGTAATTNTGGGGGGASRYNCGSGSLGAGGAGGSGIVMIRYKFQ